MAFPDVNGTDWRTLYGAAILETNQSVFRQRVSEAEEAVLRRGREIFYEHATLEEQKALEDALFALIALRTAWQLTGGVFRAPLRFSVPVLQEALLKDTNAV
jgi:hypothetical protein